MERLASKRAANCPGDVSLADIIHCDTPGPVEAKTTHASHRRAELACPCFASGGLVLPDERVKGATLPGLAGKRTPHPAHDISIAGFVYGDSCRRVVASRAELLRPHHSTGGTVLACEDVNPARRDRAGERAANRSGHVDVK